MNSRDTDETIKLWPTTRGAVKLIDGLHSATGLPWWATLSLTALGMYPASLLALRSIYGSLSSNIMMLQEEIALPVHAISS